MDTVKDMKQTFEQYEQKFKALADQKRLEIMHEALSTRSNVCV